MAMVQVEKSMRRQLQISKQEIKTRVYLTSFKAISSHCLGYIFRVEHLKYYDILKTFKEDLNIFCFI